MTTRFRVTKDPGETITMEFDFSDFGDAASNPTLTIGVHRGTDVNPDAVLLGSHSIVGAKVYQRATAGVDGVDYWVKCYADVGADRPLIDAILPVRASPRPA